MWAIDSAMLLTPVELREQSLRYLGAARKADTPAKRRLAGYAFALAQVAKAIESDGRVAEFAQGAEAGRYKHLLAQAMDDKTGQIVEELLIECQAAGDNTLRITKWRARAEELRRTADGFATPSARDSLRKAAASYNKLANDGEAALAHRDPKDKSQHT